MIKVTYADGAVIEYTYDPAGNRTTMTDHNGPSTYGYDKLNRLKTQTLPGLRTNTYDYDDSGNLTSYSDAAGSVTYGHNTLNLVDSVAEPGGSCTATPMTLCTTVTYDDANRRDKVSYPNAVVEDSDYDSSGRVTAVKATKGTQTLTNFAYTYAKDGSDTGLRRTMTENVPGVVNEKTTYTNYDGLNRLDTANTTTQPSGPQIHSWDFDYDRRSNRTKSVVDTVSTHYAYDDASQMCWKAPTPGTCAGPPAGATTYSYDAVGNQTASSAGQVLTYNAKNQTTTMAPAGGAASAHDYTGATQDERIAAGATKFNNSLLGVAYSYQGALPLPISTTVWTRDDQGTLLSQRNPDGQRYYYLFDGLGSVAAMTNGAGTVVNRYRYYPYGGPMVGPGTKEEVPNPWRFAGGYRDPDTGFTKFGARYYDPSVGRWTQQDPSGQDANPYAYVRGDPVNLVDPTGEFWRGLAQGALAVGAGVGVAACAAATAGICAGAAGAAAVSAGIGGAAGGGIYGLSEGPKTASGYAGSIALGAAGAFTGSVLGPSGAAGAHSARAGLGSTIRSFLP